MRGKVETVQIQFSFHQLINPAYACTVLSTVVPCTAFPYSSAKRSIIIFFTLPIGPIAIHEMLKGYLFCSYGCFTLQNLFSCLAFKTFYLAIFNYIIQPLSLYYLHLLRRYIFLLFLRFGYHTCCCIVAYISRQCNTVVSTLILVVVWQYYQGQALLIYILVY